MSIIQVHGGGGRVPSDRTPFVGVRVPPEVKVMVKKLSKMDRDIVKKLLKLVMQSLEGEVNYDKFSSIVQTSRDPTMEETLGMVYTGLLSLVKCGLRHSTTSLKQQCGSMLGYSQCFGMLMYTDCYYLYSNVIARQHFKEDLDELGIPADFHDDLASCVFGTKRPKVDTQLLASRPRLPQLLQLKWRVDVAISTSVLNRVLEPSIIMEMTLSTGSTKVFEVPVSQFHQLRYNVAYVLRQMEELEKRSILKIQD